VQRTLIWTIPSPINHRKKDTSLGQPGEVRECDKVRGLVPANMRACVQAYLSLEVENAAYVATYF
jgi:hypothetical protein